MSLAAICTISDILTVSYCALCCAWQGRFHIQERESRIKRNLWYSYHKYVTIVWFMLKCKMNVNKSTVCHLKNIIHLYHLSAVCSLNITFYVYCFKMISEDFHGEKTHNRSKIIIVSCRLYQNITICNTFLFAYRYGSCCYPLLTALLLLWKISVTIIFTKIF